MRRYFLLIPTLFIASILITSCEDSNADSPFGDLSPAGVTGIKTTNTEEFCCWEAGAQIHFNSPSTTYSHWNITIGESQGFFSQINFNPLHWRGKVEYMEKDKKCKEIIYIDSLTFDITTSESGWNEGTFKTYTYQYEKGESPSQMVMNTYYVKPEAGNFNTLNISDANHNYVFSFKTRSADDFNSWKIDQMPQGWMNSNGRLSMLVLPILYSLFQ
jgi:hypothetical protein